MLTFIQEILDGFQDNIITKLELIVHQDFKIFEFKIKGTIQKTFSVSLPTEWIDAQTLDCITYIDNIAYSKYPIFSEASFSVLKDALLLNTSFVMWSANAFILSKEQCEYLNRIIQRNIAFSQMTDGITLLHYSAMHDDIDVVQMFSWRAKEASELEVRCQGGKTPLDYASENNHLIIMSFLESQIKKLRALQTEVTESSTPQINKPLSDTNKQHIFDSLRIFGRLKSSSLTQKLIDAALADLVFPPVFKTKLLPLQLAYQANKSSAAMKSLLASAIQTYFEEEGAHLFKDLLSGALVPEDWNPILMRRLAGDEIIIIENPYVEATIKDGKIYWCINFGNQIYYRRPLYEPIISQARIQNRSWHLTWKEFRDFKDAGKRTGTVSITEERFVTTIMPFLHNDSLAKSIWQELCAIGILDRKFRLSQAWYPFSLNKNEPFRLKLKCLGDESHKNYQQIADTLQAITCDPKYAEIIVAGIEIFRPARASKTWTSTGLVENCNPKKNVCVITKLWDVGVARELRDHAVTQKPACEIDHIPTKSQIMDKENRDYWDIQLRYCEAEVIKIQEVIYQNNDHNLRSTSQYPNNLQSNLYYWMSQRKNLIDAKDKNSKGLSFWGIYLKREDHKAGNTNGASKTEQEDLDFYSSINTYICMLKNELDSNMFLQALGAFRYMYARMCKEHNNIANQSFISNTPNMLFDHSKKQQIDDLFITEMRGFANSRLCFR